MRSGKRTTSKRGGGGAGGGGCAPEARGGDAGALVASNVARPDAVRRFALTRVVVEGGMRIDVLGAQSLVAAPADWTVTEPREATLELLPALRAEKVDQIVVLAYLLEEEQARSRASFPEVDLITGGLTR